MHSCTVVSIIVDPEFATRLLTLGVNAHVGKDEESEDEDNYSDGIEVD